MRQTKRHINIIALLLLEQRLADGAAVGLLSASSGEEMVKYHGSIKPAGQLAIQAVVGGTISELGGGNFANGAITAAFSFMFNHVKHSIEFNKIKELFIRYRELNFNRKVLKTPHNICKEIGGEIEANCNEYNYEHVCAIRLSYAMNYSGMEIEEIHAGGLYQYGTYKGNDGKNYFINAKDMSQYLEKWFYGEYGQGVRVLNGIVYQYGPGFRIGISGHVDVVYGGRWASSPGMIPNRHSANKVRVYY